jgi:hypothetical protein
MHSVLPAWRIARADGNVTGPITTDLTLLRRAVTVRRREENWLQIKIKSASQQNGSVLRFKAERGTVLAYLALDLTLTC